MLESMFAVSLAANILQFIEFSSDLVSKAGEIRQHGAPICISHLQSVTNDLKNLTVEIEKLNSPTQRTLMHKSNDCEGENPDRRSLVVQTSVTNCVSKSHEDLSQLAIRCRSVAEDLLEALSKLQVAGYISRWKSIREALKATWGKDRIKQLCSILEGFRNELNLKILVSFRQDAAIQAAIQDTRLDVVEKGINDVAMGLMDERCGLMAAMDRQSENFQKQRDDAADSRRYYFEETVATIKASRHTRPALSSPSTRPSSKPTPAQKASAQEAILDHLNYRQMFARQHDVAKAHQKTFQWLFDNKAEAMPQHSFVGWLKDGAGCYWINGKAASGKSTLMKFIVNHPKTRAALVAWNEGKPVLMPSFFFWNPGTTLQKSQSGLIRSVLFEVLSRCKKIIPKVLPDLYREELRAVHWQVRSAIQPLSDVELKIAFTKLTEYLPTRTCFFIDGLDEYVGDIEDIADSLSLLARHHNVKIVVSSRPTPPCLRAFEGFAGLRLQDLTKDDIRNYVNDQIVTNDTMQDLLAESPKQASEFVTEIVMKSSGVFLWVTLVVKSLLDGLKNFDSIDHLRQRLEQLPQELDELYKLMLGSMISLYKQQASKYLQIALRHSQVETEQPLSLQRLAFADIEDPKAFIRISEGDLDNGRLLRLCRATCGRILSCCCGLLEAQEPVSPQTPVIFLHKTVIDFLSDAQQQQYLHCLTSNTSFDPNVALLKSSLVWMKVCRKEWQWNDKVSLDKSIHAALQKVEIFLIYCQLAETTSREGHLTCLHECDRIMTHGWAQVIDVRKVATYMRHQSHWSVVLSTTNNRIWRNVNSFPSLLAAAGLGLSLDQYIQKWPNQMSASSKEGLLVEAIDLLGRATEIQVAARHQCVIETLLKHSASPNATSLREPSAWIRALAHFKSAFGATKLYMFPDWQLLACRLLEDMIRHGADVNTIQNQAIYHHESIALLADCRSALNIVQCCIASAGYVRRAGVQEVQSATSTLIELMVDRGAKSEAWLDGTPVELFYDSAHTVLRDRPLPAKSASSCMKKAHSKRTHGKSYNFVVAHLRSWLKERRTISKV